MTGWVVILVSSPALVAAACIAAAAARDDRRARTQVERESERERARGLRAESRAFRRSLMLGPIARDRRPVPHEPTSHGGARC